MDALVQSAIDIAKRGDTKQAIEVLRQNLNEHPDNIDAWLVLATLVEEPTRKRQVLNRVLSLDATNQIARDMMLEMDREEMSALRSRPISSPRQNVPPQSVSTPPPPAPKVTTAGPAQKPAPQTSPAPQPRTTSASLDKPLVFKYPLLWRILMYFFIFFFGCIGLLIATQNVINSLPFLVIAFLTGLVAMMFLPSVEINQTGIRAVGTFSSSEAKWDEIVSMKSHALKRRLELHNSDGEVVSVSTQVGDYPRIVEIIRQKRPDLFGIAPQPAMGSASNMTSTGPTSTPAFTGTRVFKKGIFTQYGVILLMIPFCMFGAWALLASDEKFVGIGVMLVGLFFMVMSLFAVNQITVEPNKIKTESFFSQKEYTPAEIREITMKTVRSRRGIASNFVNIQPVEGSAISLGGFSDGDEMLYGFLVNWWNAHQIR